MDQKTVYALPDCLTGDDIRRVRKKLNLTQEGFAKLAGVSKPTVVSWENSGKKITGPIILAVKMLEENPDTSEKFRIPSQEAPLRLLYYYRNMLCTLIDVNDRIQQVRIKNFTRWPQFRAFGINQEPTYEDYQEFLRSRCFPESRDKLKLELRKLGLPFYDPLLIIEKTEGRMAEDDFYVKIERRQYAADD